MATDCERAFDFQRRTLARTSTRTRELPWGTAYFNDEFRLRYDSNMAIADRSLGGAVAADVVSALDDAYASFRHREVEFASADDADSIAMGMAEHGYAIERMVVMAHRREPDRAPEPAGTEEIDVETYRELNVEVTAREPWGKQPGMAEMMADFRRVLVERIGARFFAQRIGGRLAGSCELYVDGDTAQVEDVNTLAEFRGRGVARNVVLRAVEEATRAGATLVFLFADDDDWPKHLYDRLGFDAIGRGLLFTRRPEGEGEPKPPDEA